MPHPILQLKLYHNIDQHLAFPSTLSKRISWYSLCSRILWLYRGICLLTQIITSIKVLFTGNCAETSTYTSIHTLLWNVTNKFIKILQELYMLSYWTCWKPEGHHHLSFIPYSDGHDQFLKVYQAPSPCLAFLWFLLSALNQPSLSGLVNILSFLEIYNFVLRRQDASCLPSGTQVRKVIVGMLNWIWDNLRTIHPPSRQQCNDCPRGIIQGLRRACCISLRQCLVKLQPGICL